MQLPSVAAAPAAHSHLPTSLSSLLTHPPPCVATPPTHTASKQGMRRMKASVESAPKDNKEQQWPSRGLKKVESAPKDNKETFLFRR